MLGSTMEMLMHLAQIVELSAPHVKAVMPYFSGPSNTIICSHDWYIQHTHESSRSMALRMR